MPPGKGMTVCPTQALLLCLSSGGSLKHRPFHPGRVRVFLSGHTGKDKVQIVCSSFEIIGFSVLYGIKMEIYGKVRYWPHHTCLVSEQLQTGIFSWWYPVTGAVCRRKKENAPPPLHPFHQKCAKIMNLILNEANWSSSKCFSPLCLSLFKAKGQSWGCIKCLELKTCLFQTLPNEAFGLSW